MDIWDKRLKWSSERTEWNVKRNTQHVDLIKKIFYELWYSQTLLRINVKCYQFIVVSDDFFYIFRYFINVKRDRETVRCNQK